LSSDIFSTFAKSTLPVCAGWLGSRNPAAAAATRICANKLFIAETSTLVLLFQVNAQYP
jgi:hypothetical protein